ncbi:MAG: beta-ketoacyl synthase N-terminal-like domain-containing protein [Sandaracinaceae bacterium]
MQWADERAPVVSLTTAVNGLAYDRHQSWAFWRADGAALAETPFVMRDGNRGTMSIVRSLDPRLVGEPRIGMMMEAALLHLDAPMSKLRAPGRVGVWAAIGERFAAKDDPYFGRAAPRLSQRLSAFFGARGVESTPTLVARGHAGFAHALLDACRALAEGAVELAVVGGADTYYDPLVVDILEEGERMFGPETLEGFIPGEGAAFVVITTRAFAQRAGLEVLARVETVATDREPAPMASDAPTIAAGLTSVVRCVTDRLKSERRMLDWMLTDLTSEPYRAREITLALPRAFAPGGLDTAGATYRHVVDERFVLSHLPQAFGDLGAATMPTALTIATEAFRRGDPVASSCAITGSSTGGDRGAILVRAG